MFALFCLTTKNAKNTKEKEQKNFALFVLFVVNSSLVRQKSANIVNCSLSYGELAKAKAKMKM